MIPALIFAAAVIALLSYEGWALATRHTTISEYVWRLNRVWPPIVFLAGLVIGGLAAHFTWPVCF